MPSDPASQLAAKLRVPRDRIVKLANELGIDVNSINQFGEGSPFPVNYYAQILETPVLTQRMRKSAVLSFVKGYAAMCIRNDTDFNSSLLFFFYSTKVVRPADEEPLVMEIHFHQPVGKDDLDPHVGNIGTIDLTEPDFNPPGSTYYKQCIEQRGKLGTIR